MKTKRLLALLTAGALLGAAAAEQPVGKDAAVGVEVRSVAGGNNAFACDLLARLGAGNVFFSPTSLSTALAMCYAGAGGDTAREMAKTMHFALPAEQLHPAVARLTRILNDAGDPPAYQMNIANALWTQAGFPLQVKYVERMKRDYAAGEHFVDFQHNVEGARQTINAWVEEQTQRRIKELIGKNALTPDMRLVLTNAIYFKAKWLNPFRKESTFAQDFHLSAGKSVKASMMHQTEFAPYYEDADMKLLEKVYQGGALSMIFILPTKKHDLARVEKQMTAGALAAWTAQLQPAQVRIALPKLEMNTAFELSRVLAQMGMPQAFTAQADFRPMADVPGQPLYIGQVIHQAFVAVDELGTEAAAATAIGMRAGSAPPRDMKEFIADQPFLFLIRDRRTGAVLFIGRCAEPPKAG
jgi:serpin B